MKRILPVLLAISVAFNCFAQQPPVGSAAPDIKLQDEKGSVVNLASLKGKVVVIDFWASWCGPCRRSIPALKDIYKKYKDKGLEVYAISVDIDKSDWQKAIKADETSWVHVIDDKNAVARLWKVQYIPNTFLLDKNGTIVSINANHAALEQQIAKLLN
jgi:peroxiredoxin